MITRCFTFGYGHKDPLDNSSQAETYARITAPTEQMCREVMLRVFGQRWAFEYGEDIEEKWNYGPLRQKYHIFWDVDRDGVGIPITRLPTRKPVDDFVDDEEILYQGIETILDPDDHDVIFGDAPVLRRVESVELPTEDIR